MTEYRSISVPSNVDDEQQMALSMRSCSATTIEHGFPDSQAIHLPMQHDGSDTPSAMDTSIPLVVHHPRPISAAVPRFLTPPMSPAASPSPLLLGSSPPYFPPASPTLSPSGSSSPSLVLSSSPSPSPPLSESWMEIEAPQESSWEVELREELEKELQRMRQVQWEEEIQRERDMQWEKEMQLLERERYEKEMQRLERERYKKLNAMAARKRGIRKQRKDILRQREVVPEWLVKEKLADLENEEFLYGSE
ncbi:hypothetical protein DBV05_g12306 [Lasiodiplodia theobromae]|uniref:Uncharacterized protein n=1 Tax=Lasiodiplodia theobromae TaxID=45133 RepID=A0A5N5CUJ6_9PEZI|nr:hypothetical protein DBV05_g12306 [Lasiodiplodia theobromae]